MRENGAIDDQGMSEPTIVCQHTAQAALLTRLRLPLSQLPANLTAAMERLMAQVLAQRLSLAGGLFLAVHELSAGDVDLELGLPVHGTLRDGDKVHVGSIPAGRYLTFAHGNSDLPLIDEFRAMRIWLRNHTERTSGPLYAVITRDPALAAGRSVTLIQRRIAAGGAASQAHDVKADALTDKMWAGLAAAIDELARLSWRLPAPRASEEIEVESAGTGETLRVEDAMSSEVVTCRMADSAQHAAQLMWEHDVGALPVLAATGRPIAMVTDRDLCMAAYTQGKTLQQICVESAMSQQIQVCRPGDSLSAAERTMTQHQVQRLPVVDGRGALAGILSLNDIAVTRANAARWDFHPFRIDDREARRTLTKQRMGSGAAVSSAREKRRGSPKAG